MHKIALLSILMPMFVVASDQPTTQEALVLKGSAVLSWYRPELAKDLFSAYHAKDAEWLSIALGKEIDPETQLLRVLIDPKDGKLPKYLSDRICFKHRETQEDIAFPRWLPLHWFADKKDGDVVTTPQLFGMAVEIVCAKQAGGKPFHDALAGLVGPQQFVECELRAMDKAATSCSQEQPVNNDK